MDLLRPADFPLEENDRVFHEPVLGRVVLVLLFGGLGIAWTVLPMLAGPAGFLGWIVGLPCLLVSALITPGVLRGLRGGHWVVRLRREGLALHLRSYLNADLPPDDPVVLWIERAEIAALVPLRQRRTLPGGDGDRTMVEERLEIRLVHARTAELAQALKRERTPRDRGRSHYHAHGVRLAAVDRIELTWRSANFLLRPGLKRFLRAAEVDYRIEDLRASRLDDWRELDARAFDDLVLELCEQGDRFTAIRLLRERHGWHLTEARHFVDELSGRREAG
jgi:hypothetical protein